ncbi:SIP domain-containing protein [Mucilaginibacter sp. UR6-1]|uniref:SIP domain-containing protein n=1 Tax=Mucilaginibacter sp. UR6-1 TaxID=1435643 RepID=UPI001E572617|nr:SIP domain-containing protein [Mucilaginibacter sp. UR6-1]MCC8407904.1 SIP domain-containing protein [Mucilaginibacter sp. UR6-1]
MSALLLSRIKRKATKIIEDQFLKTGYVLETRTWITDDIIEIDLHLPSASMQWNEVQHMKCKVAEFTYRDYTPAAWDADTQTCTLYIDVNHKGPGALWARQLNKGDCVEYLGIATTKHSPVNTSAIVCLGDESAIGHLLAMQQLTQPATRFTGAVVMADNANSKLFTEYFKTPLQPVERDDNYGHHSLIKWLLQQSENLENTIFYLAGNSTMVAQLRKTLRSQGYGSSQIKAHGFWQ